MLLLHSVTLLQTGNEALQLTVHFHCQEISRQISWLVLSVESLQLSLLLLAVQISFHYHVSTGAIRQGIVASHHGDQGSTHLRLSMVAFVAGNLAPVQDFLPGCVLRICHSSFSFLVMGPNFLLSPWRKKKLCGNQGTHIINFTTKLFTFELMTYWLACKSLTFMCNFYFYVLLFLL